MSYINLHSTLVVPPNLAASFTGHCGYEIGARYVYRLDHNLKRLSRVLRSKLPADFGPDMKAGAFGMADAYNAAQGVTS